MRAAITSQRVSAGLSRFAAGAGSMRELEFYQARGWDFWPREMRQVAERVRQPGRWRDALNVLEHYGI